MGKVLDPIAAKTMIRVGVKGIDCDTWAAFAPQNMADLAMGGRARIR